VDTSGRDHPTTVVTDRGEPVGVLVSSAERPPLASAVTPPITDEQVSAFLDLGYLVLPACLPPDWQESLCREVDRWVDTDLRSDSIACCTGRWASGSAPATMELELGAHGWLVSYPPVMAALARLMGPAFAFHHMHSSRHDPGTRCKDWHHDYEQRPQRDRRHLMIHVLYYLTGLDGTIGDLVVLPGTQHIIAEKNALAHVGERRLAGEVVIDSLPPGSAVVMHSALFHARRAKLGGEGHPRYFVDCSYCQVGPRWPSVKPYWRHMLARAREMGLDHGEWPDLFDERHFYDPVAPSDDKDVRAQL